MVERNVVASFTGQLFEAAAATKKWTSISSSNASIQVVNVEDEAHQIIGLDKDQEIFVHNIDNDMQLRSKDNFVQWKKKGSTGQPTTYGVRLKDGHESQRLEGIVGGIMAMLEIIPSPAPWPTGTKPQSNEKPIKPDHQKDMLLKVHLPGKQTTVITVPSNIMMEELLSLIMMKRRLDSRYYELVLPPSKPKSMQAQLLPTTPLHTLSINEIHVVKRSKPVTNKKHSASSPPDMTNQPLLTKQRSMTLPAGQKKISSSSLVETSTPPINQKRTEQFSPQKQTAMKLLTVYLPYDQRTVIQVSPAMTMPQLLVYICEKRNLKPAHHSLLIPSPTSGQVKMATKELTVSSLRSSAITLVDLKASSSGNLNSVIPDYSISGKRGNFSPTKITPETVDSTKKKMAPQVPANESKQANQNALHSVEAKVVERSDKEQTPVRHIAKRKAPPPPKGVKKDPLSQRESETNSSLRNPAIAHTKAPPPPGSPGKRPAPAIPTASKQPTTEKQISKQTSGSALITHQPPASPSKRLLPSTAEDVTDHPVVVPLISATKKRRPAPTRPPQRAAPPPPSPQAEHKLELSEFQTDDFMDTSVPAHVTAQLQQRVNRPGSATSAQIKLEINELEASLADTIEEAEWHLQQKSSNEQDQSVDETDSSYIPMDINVSLSSKQADNKIVGQPQALAPDQMISESGTVRGIKGRVKEQIASNQSKLMVEGLLAKKQQPFARTPLSVFHKAENLDGVQAAEQRTSLKKYGSQEALSFIENEDVIKRSNSLKNNNQTVKRTDSKQKPRGKAPPPPQDRVKVQQPQQVPSSQSTAAPEGYSVFNIPAENNQILQQNAETVAKQTAQDFILANKTDAAATVDTGKKIPPKVKPKTARAKSKEAEDRSINAPESSSKASPEVVFDRSKPHPSLSKRAKSESQIKHIPQTSPRIDKKPNAIIESSDDGQQILVLSPVGNNNTNKDASVRIFLPPPPPILPPVQESENSTKNYIDNKVPLDMAISTNNSTVVTNNDVSIEEGTVLHSSAVASGQNINCDNTTLQLQNNDNISNLPGNDDLEFDSKVEAVKSLPHVVFQSLEDLPMTPPGSPCDELELDETMFELESRDNDGIDMVPPPPPLEDLNADDVDGIIPPLDDFDPLSLPPPLLVDNNDDDVFDIIPPPPSVTEDIIASTTAPPTFIDATPAPSADDPMIALPPSSLPFEDDIVPVTTEFSFQPFGEDETFEDLPVESLPPVVDDKVTTVPEDDYDNSDEIILNMFPDDISQSESDTDLPTMNDNIVTELESNKLDAIIDAAPVDEDDKIISQFKENIITTELESAESDVSIDDEAKKPEEQEEIAEMQDPLSSIIASLETMLQDEPQSHEEQVMDDIDTMPPPSAGWVWPFNGQEVPTEALVNGSKDDVYEADLDQQSSADINQTTTVTPKLDTETNKPKVQASEVDTEFEEAVPTANTQASDTKSIAPTSEVDSTDGKLKATVPIASTEITDIKPAYEVDTTNIKPKAKANTETTDTKPKSAAPMPVRAAPPPPPPPPPIGKVKSPPKIVTGLSSNTTSPTKAKSPPPAVKPKPKRPVSGSLAEEFQDELAKKLKKRQQKIHDWAKDDDKPKQPPSQTAPTVFTKHPSATQPRTFPQNTAPVLPKLQANSAPLMQGDVSNMQHTTSPTGSQEQMEQVQLLQNQVLQQQILMLQQQLQQLQQQMPQGQMGSNSMMAMPQPMPQAGIGIQTPQVGTGMQTGVGMQIPQAANSMQAPQLSTGMQMPMQQQNETLNKSAQSFTDGKTFNATHMSKITTGLNTSTDSESTCSESPPPPPATSPPPLDNPTPHDQVVRRNLNKDSAIQHRPSSQLLRSKAFGEYEDLLDDILEEVREVDHNTILKKPPPPPPNQTGGPHIEMASLLAEAMKQRRINITTRRLSSASVEEEQDNSHEWD